MITRSAEVRTMIGRRWYDSYRAISMARSKYVAKILLVEDEPSLQATIAYNLKKAGYEIASVGASEQVTVTATASTHFGILRRRTLLGRCQAFVIVEQRALSHTSQPCERPPRWVYHGSRMPRRAVLIVLVPLRHRRSSMSGFVRCVDIDARSHKIVLDPLLAEPIYFHSLRAPSVCASVLQGARCHYM